MPFAVSSSCCGADVHPTHRTCVVFTQALHSDQLWVLTGPKGGPHTCIIATHMFLTGGLLTF